MRKYLLQISIILFIAVAIYLYLYSSETGHLPSGDIDVNLAGLFLIASLVSGMLLPFVSNFLNKKFSWTIAFTKRFFSGYFLSVICCWVVLALFALIYFASDNDLNLNEFFSSNSDLLYKLMILTGFVLFIYSLADLAFYSYRQYTVEQIKVFQQQREKLNLQYAALKRQLSPHFLFNSLHTTSSLLYRKTDTAETFIRKLAITYKKILDSVNYNLIPLEKEIEIIKNYKYLLEVRFEEALAIDINLDRKLFNTLVPPLSLQLLVENAIKHNLISEDKPLKIVISCLKPGYITVSNNFNRKKYYIQVENQLIENPENSSMGIGQKNIRNRYAYFTQAPVIIEKKESYKVHVPILDRLQIEKQEMKAKKVI